MSPLGQLVRDTGVTIRVHEFESSMWKKREKMLNNVIGLIRYGYAYSASLK